MNDFQDFKNMRKNNISQLSELKLSNKELNIVCENLFKKNYVYNFDWLGVPIIQYPQDIIALQEIIWKTRPNIIIETGVARGGSIIFYASILQMLNNGGKVIGIDIDIRPHNRKIIEEHPLSFCINLIQGSSTDLSIFHSIKSLLNPSDKIMVVLDSNHTHEHVLKEIELYSELIKKDSYLIVLDTFIEDMPEDFFPDRPWGKGNNAKTAVHEFLKTCDRFEIDDSIHNKLLITSAPDGYLKCIK